MSDKNEAVRTIREEGNNTAISTINPKSRMMPPEPQDEMKIKLPPSPIVVPIL